MTDRDQLIVNNLNWAEQIAVNQTRRLPRCVQVDDIKSAAYFGLVDAATKYKREYGVPFTAYAARRVIGSITDYLRELLRWKFESLSDAI